MYYLYFFKSIKDETPLVFSILGEEDPGIMLHTAKLLHVDGGDGNGCGWVWVRDEDYREEPTQNLRTWNPKAWAALGFGGRLDPVETVRPVSP